MIIVEVDSGGEKSEERLEVGGSDRNATANEPWHWRNRTESWSFGVEGVELPREAKGETEKETDKKEKKAPQGDGDRIGGMHDKNDTSTPPFLASPSFLLCLSLWHRTHAHRLTTPQKTQRGDIGSDWGLATGCDPGTPTCQRS